MNLQEFALLLMSVATSVGGQFFLKLGALKLVKGNSANALSNVISIASTPELLIALSCYGLGAIAYILLLTRVNLSIATPSISLVYVFQSF